MTEKSAYIVRPFDVLYFRNNKAFDFGEWYSEGIFPPYPSTFQGLIRTNLLMQQGYIDNDGEMNSNQQKAVKLIGDDSTFPFDMEGPFVAKNNTLYFPAPKDMIPVGKNAAKQVQIKENTLQNDLGITLAYADQSPKQKFIYYSQSLLPLALINEYRLNGEIKTINQKEAPYYIEDHVGIMLENGLKKAKEGHFYMTPYIRFAMENGLFFSIAHKEGSLLNFENQYGKLGSESRGVYFEKAQNNLTELTLENSFYKQIVQKGKFKLILLSHGIFEQGWLPFSFNEKEGLSTNFKSQTIKLKLLFATCDKPLKISGFSQIKKGVKKQVSAVPAGSVYYFTIAEKQGNEDVIVKWLKSLDNHRIPNGMYSDMGYNHVVFGKII